MSFNIKNIRIGVVGLGYVGLPLAVEFGRKYPTVGFDVKESRIADLKNGKDATLEVTTEELDANRDISASRPQQGIADCNFYIVTVPTPIGDSNRPLLTPVRSAQQADWQGPQNGRRRRVRIDGLPGRDRGILCAVPGEGVRSHLQQGLFRRLQPGTHQPGRQRAPRHDDPESYLRVDAGSRRLRRLPSIAASSRPALTRPRASRSRKLPRSSRTRSAT